MVKLLAFMNCVHFFFHNNFSLLITDSKVELQKACSGLPSIFAKHLTTISYILYAEFTDARCGEFLPNSSLIRNPYLCLFQTWAIFWTGEKETLIRNLTSSRRPPWGPVSRGLKGTQEWEFFWLRFWILYYFIVSYVKILDFAKKTFWLGQYWRSYDFSA